MKKIAVIAIAVLFSLAGVAYAHQDINLAAPITHLALKVTYEEEIGYGSTTLTEGRNFVTVTPGIGKAITGGLNADPVLYFIESGPQIYISWISPNQSSTYYNQRIWPIGCSLGVISMKPQVPPTKPPATKSTSLKGIGACTICPDGIGFNTPNDPTSGATDLCNGGGTPGVGYLTFTGTDYKAYDTGSPAGNPNYITTSVSITGTIAGSAINYVGEDWASIDGKQYADWTAFPAMFTGTFAVKVTPCPPSTDPYCLLAYP